MFKKRRRYEVELVVDPQDDLPPGYEIKTCWLRLPLLGIEVEVELDRADALALRDELAAAFARETA